MNRAGSGPASTATAAVLHDETSRDEGYTRAPAAALHHHGEMLEALSRSLECAAHLTTEQLYELTFLCKGTRLRTALAIENALRDLERVIESRIAKLDAVGK